MRIRIITIACFLSLAVAGATNARGQSGKLPSFAMMLSNGEVFRAHSLPMGKPIVMIYFSPDCDHCEIMMKEFIRKEASFRKASVVLITHLQVAKVSKFIQQYDLKKYSNLYVGTEGNTFFVRNFYRIEQMPFIALHDKNGDMVKTYRKEGALPDLISQLNKLK